MDIIPASSIKAKIFRVRNSDVMLDSDLAELYGVETKRINEAVKNNPEKFPADFMFECGEEEWNILKSKFSTSSWGGRRTVPKVFTEQGVRQGSGKDRFFTKEKVIRDS